MLAASSWNSSHNFLSSTLPIAHSYHLSVAEAISRIPCVKSGKRRNLKDALLPIYRVNFVF